MSCAAQPTDAATSVLTPAIHQPMGQVPPAYRLAVFGILHGTNVWVAAALVSALTAALLNEAVDVEVLDRCGESPPLLAR